MPVRRLAAVTGIPERTIDDMEAGRPVDVGVAILIAEAVGLDVVATMSLLARNPTAATPLDADDARYPSPLD